MTNEIFINQNILSELRHRSEKIILKEKNLSYNKVLKLENLTLEKFKKIDALFSKTFETCYSCMELVTQLDEEGDEMSAEELRNSEKKLKEQIKSLKLGIRNILQQFVKYENYGEYRERLLKVYFMVRKIVKILEH